MNVPWCEGWFYLTQACRRLWGRLSGFFLCDEGSFSSVTCSWKNTSENKSDLNFPLCCFFISGKIWLMLKQKARVTCSDYYSCRLQVCDHKWISSVRNVGPESERRSGFSGKREPEWKTERRQQEVQPPHVEMRWERKWSENDHVYVNEANVSLPAFVSLLFSFNFNIIFSCCDIFKFKTVFMTSQHASK